MTALEIENVQTTAAFVMQFLPCPVYFTLAGHKISATLQDTAQSDGRFLLRLRIEFENVWYDNPCAAGKAMHYRLCSENNLDNTPPKTFDGWNKLKVCIGDQIYRLEHILPSSARKGLTAVTCLPAAPKDKRKHDLRSMLEETEATKRPVVWDQHHHHHYHIGETDLRPFMTTLTHHFGNHEGIVAAVCSLPPGLIADITGSALLVRT